MSAETKHLLFWWKIWLERLARTSYHLVNRSAYRKWKAKNCRPKFQEIEIEEFGDGLF